MPYACTDPCRRGRGGGVDAEWLGRRHRRGGRLYRRDSDDGRCHAHEPSRRGRCDAARPSTTVDSVEVTVTGVTVDTTEARALVTLDTHAGSLGGDLSASSLTVAGARIGQATWSGDPPGSHHRSGQLTFPGTSAGPGDDVELAVSGLPGPVVFTWKVPATSQTAPWAERRPRPQALAEARAPAPVANIVGGRLPCALRFSGRCPHSRGGRKCPCAGVVTTCPASPGPAPLAPPRKAAAVVA